MKYTYKQLCMIYDRVVDGEDEGDYTELAKYARDAARVIGTIENALAQGWSYYDTLRAVEWALALGGTNHAENAEGL